MINYKMIPKVTRIVQAPLYVI